MHLNACCMCNCACTGDKFIFRRQHALYAVANGTRPYCNALCADRRGKYLEEAQYLCCRLVWLQPSSPQLAQRQYSYLLSSIWVFVLSVEQVKKGTGGGTNHSIAKKRRVLVLVWWCRSWRVVSRDRCFSGLCQLVAGYLLMNHGDNRTSLFS